MSLLAAISAAFAVQADREEEVQQEDPSDWSLLADALSSSSGESFGTEDPPPYVMTPPAPKVKKPSSTQVAEQIADEFLRMDRGVIPDHLLLAVLLSGTTRGNPVELASKILRSVDGRIERILDPSTVEQVEIKPIGLARLLAATEFARRVMARAATMNSSIINGPAKAAEIGFRLSLGDVEILSAVYVDRRQRFLGARTISIGSDGFTVVDPRMILRPALELGALGVILFHNHPSGDPTPSSQDLEVTRRVGRACTIMGVSLVDHLVLSGQGKYISLAERGELPSWPPESTY